MEDRQPPPPPPLVLIRYSARFKRIQLALGESRYNAQVVKNSRGRHVRWLKKIWRVPPTTSRQPGGGGAPFSHIWGHPPDRIGVIWP